MLEKIIGFSLKFKLIIILFTLTIAAFGIYAILNIPVGAVPDITNNQVQVITTSGNLSTQEILEMYAKRWSIEVFFRNCKQKLAFDKCQLRKQRGIERMWLLLSLVHFLCCTLPDYRGAFEKGFAYFRERLLQA